MKRRHYIGSLIISVLLVFIMTSGVSAEIVEKLSLKAGTSLGVYASIQKDDSIHRAEYIDYEILDTTVASVDENGNIDAIAPGETILEITAVVEGVLLHESVDINVYSDVEFFEIDTNAVAVNGGETYKVPYTLRVRAGSETDRSWVKWSSSNLEVASVDAEGNVSVYGIGKTVITGTTEDKQFTDTMNIVGLEGDSKIIVNNGYAKVLNVGEIFTPAIYSRDVEVDLSNIEIQSLTPNRTIVLEDGSVKAISAGNGRILYIDRENSLSAILDTRNVSMVSDIQFEEDLLTFTTLGEMQQLNYELIPYDPDSEIVESGIVWGSMNPEVASVNKGVVTATGYGSTQIFAKSIDGSHISKIWIHVTTEPEKTYDTLFEEINLSPIKYEAYVGQEIKLDISTKPDFEKFSQIKVSVLKGPSSQIELREDGYYFVPSETARNVVYVRTPDGHVDHQSVYARSMIASVIIPEDMIAVTKNGHDAMYVGQEVDLKYTFKPAGNLKLSDIIDTEVTWTTSDSSVIEIVDNRKLLAHKLGEATIKVKTADGGTEDEALIGVYPTSFSYTLVQRVERQVGDIYKPEATYSTIYAFDEPIVDEFVITVSGYSMTEADVQKEIEYFSKRSESVKDSGKSVSMEYYKYQQQVKLYSEMLKTKSNGYCKISKEIETQLFNQEPFVNISGSYIEFLRAGKVDFVVKSTDNELARSFTVFVSESDQSAVLKLKLDGIEYELRKGE